MALRNVVKYGDPILRKKSRTVEAFDLRIATLVEDMFETMYKDKGCLSLPGRYETVRRPQKVQVKGQDREGKWHVYTGEDLKARAFCHEIDHLDGVLFIDRMDKTVKKD